MHIDPSVLPPAINARAGAKSRTRKRRQSPGEKLIAALCALAGDQGRMVRHSERN